MAAAKFDIEKYDRHVSFVIWQMKMKAFLTQNGLQKAILGKDKLPEKLSEEQKLDLDEKALATIQLCLSNEVLCEVIHEKTAKDLWEKLESLYMTKNLTSKLVVKHRMHILNMVEGTSLKSHIDEFNSILIDLENLDIKYEEEDKALMLLRFVPPSFRNIRETLIHSRKTLTVEEVKESLFAKDLVDKEFSNDKNSSEVLVVRGKQKNKHSNMICNYCKKKGYINCLKLQNKNKEKVGDNDDSANIGVVQDGFCDLHAVTGESTKF